MKKSIIFILFFSCFTFFVNAQNFTNKNQNITIAKPEKSLKTGENLRYSVEWLGIPIGSIILSSLGTEKVNGYECCHITAGARPNRFLSKFYDFEYTVHTYIDKKNFSTRRFIKIRRVRDKSNKVTIDFDWEKKIVTYTTEGEAPGLDISPVREEIAAMTPTSYEVLAGTQDLFSSFYYLRLLELKENQSYPLNIYYGERNWTVDAKVKKPFLKEIRKKGAFAIFEVVIDSDLNAYILGKYRLSVFFTTDSRRIPLEFKLGAGIGSVRGKIQNIPD